jgi:hypothetical protein
VSLSHNPATLRPEGWSYLALNDNAKKELQAWVGGCLAMKLQHNIDFL